MAHGDENHTQSSEMERNDVLFFGISVLVIEYSVMICQMHSRAKDEISISFPLVS